MFCDFLSFCHMEIDVYFFSVSLRTTTRLLSVVPPVVLANHCHCFWSKILWSLPCRSMTLFILPVWLLICLTLIPRAALMVTLVLTSWVMPWRVSVLLHFALHYSYARKVGLLFICIEEAETEIYLLETVWGYGSIKYSV